MGTEWPKWGPNLSQVETMKGQSLAFIYETHKIETG